MAATSDSKTSANSEGGTDGWVVIPLPRIRNSCIPRLSLILAQVWRLTTIDLIRVRSPSKYCGKLPKEQFADDCPQDRIAEKFQAFVGSQAVLRPRGMRQRSLEQSLVRKRIADPLFTTLQQRL